MAQILQMPDPISTGSGLQESGRQICRFCLESSEDYLNLLEKCGEEIATFLQQYHSITIDHCDARPKSACLSCVGRITSFRTLCDTIRQSEQTLKEIYGDSDVKSIKKEDEEEEEEVFPESFSESLTEDFAENFPQFSPVSIPKPTIKTELPDDPDHLMLEEYYRMQCDWCKKEFSKYIELHLHMRHEHKTRRWYIRCCEVKHWHKKEMLEHIRYHKHPDEFKCQYCQRQFMKQYAINAHIQNCHKPETKRFVCGFCQKTFAVRGTLKVHIERTHMNLPKVTRKPILSNSVTESNKKCICEICGKDFRDGQKLKLHMKRHDSPLEPDGTPHRPFKCDKCDSAYKTKNSLNSHKKKHAAYGQYKCEECGKISPSPAALSKHIQDVHTLTRDFVCHICNKGFKRDIALKEHIATHTGAYLYTCKYCPKEFRATATKSLHVRREHPEMLKKR